MSDNDEMTVTAELRDRVAGLAGSAPPPLEAITARGRARRRHRRLALAGLCVAGTTAATALAFDLTGVPGVAGPAAAPATIRAAAPAMIRTAAFTIVGNHDGTVTLTINPLELFDSTALESDLAQYGIPALVTTDELCTSDPAPADISQVESYDPGAPGDDATITIDPTAMPAGSELSFGTVGVNGGAQASYSSLIDPNAYTCTSTPPTDDQQHPAREGFFALAPGN
jgi:hypothetical protein